MSLAVYSWNVVSASKVRAGTSLDEIVRSQNSGALFLDSVRMSKLLAEGSVVVIGLSASQSIRRHPLHSRFGRSGLWKGYKSIRIERAVTNAPCDPDALSCAHRFNGGGVLYLFGVVCYACVQLVFRIGD